MPRCLCKGAIVADVSAKVGQGDKNFLGIGE